MYKLIEMCDVIDLLVFRQPLISADFVSTSTAYVNWPTTSLRTYGKGSLVLWIGQVHIAYLLISNQDLKLKMGHQWKHLY